MGELTVQIVEKNTEKLQENNAVKEQSKQKTKFSLEELEAAMGPGESFVDKEEENPELEDFLDQIISNRVDPEANKQVDEETKVKTEKLVQKEGPND